MEAKERELIELIEKGRGEIVDLLVRLLRVPSRTGEEGPGQKIVQEVFRDMELNVDVFEPDVKELFDTFPHVAQYPSSWQPELDMPLRFPDECSYEQLRSSEYFDRLTYRERPNVVGILRGRGDGRSIILNGHIDVVTVEPRTKWRHDPWGAEIDGDRLYGRGSTDMKGGLAAMMKAVDFIKRAGITLRGDVILQSVVNEEHSGNGTLACIVRGYRADAAIVTEPSECGRIGIGSNGGVYWEIRLQGRQVHTGHRWQDGKMYGVSAIEKTPAVIEELLAMEREENSDETKLSLSVGMIRGGAYATSTALECVINGSLYFSPLIGTGVAGIRVVKKKMRAAIARAVEKDDWLKENPPELSFQHYDDAYLITPSEEIVQTVESSAEDVLDRTLTKEVIGAYDGRHLANQAGIPTVRFGPGINTQSHGVDEYTSIDQVIQATKVLAVAIYRWCR